MTDFGTTVHFKTRNRQLATGAPAGGFCRVYGRFEDWEAFEREVTLHFRRHFHYDVVEFEDREEISGLPKDDLGASLVRELDEYPIRYQTMHLYAADEA